MRTAWIKALLLILLALVPASSCPAAQVGSDGFYAEPFIVPAIDMHTAPINRLDADIAGRFLITGSDDKSVHIWSRENGQLLRTIRVATGPGFAGRVFAVALSPNGDTIASGGFTDVQQSESHIYLFNRATGQQIGLISGLPGVVNQLVFSPDGSRLVAALGGAHGIRIYDARTMQQIAADTDYGDSSYAAVFDSKGRLATTSFDGKIRLYDANLLRLQSVVAVVGERPFGIAFQPNGRFLAVGYFGTRRIDLLDSATLVRIQAADMVGLINGDLAKVAWSSDGTRLFAAGSSQRERALLVRAWTDDGQRVLQDYKVAENTITGLHSFADGTLAVAAGDPRLTLLRGDGTVQWAIQPQTVDYREQDTKFAVSADGMRIRFDLDATKSVTAAFDLGKRVLDLKPPLDPTLLPAKEDGMAIIWRNTNAPTLAGQLLSIDAHENSRSMAIAPAGDSFVLGSEWSLSRFRKDGTRLWRVQTPGVVWATNITADGRVVVAAYSDGTIRWHRLSDGAELLAFLPHVDGRRWVAWTPLGQYMASPGGEEMIAWQINFGQKNAPEVYSAARFRDRYYRPDVVQRVLAELDPGRALEAANHDAGQVTTTKSIIAETPPRVIIGDPADFALIKDGSLPVTYQVEDVPGKTIDWLRLRLDGQVVATQSNLIIPASGRLSGEMHFQLEGAGQMLSLTAKSDKGESDPATVHIRRPAFAGNPKPDLYVLAVGITHFQSSKVPILNYSVNDVTSFAAQMRAQEGGLYRRVLVRTLVEREATNRAIMDGLFWLEREMQQSDVATIFLSTHGQDDASGRLYLLPYDVSMEDELDLRCTAVRYTDLRDTLSRLAERGKTMVFLDACHSGNVFAGVKAVPTDVDKVAADLASSESGVIVFSSSTGRQFSLERADLHHGVFTYALLEAFTGKAARDPPFLYVSDLNIWLRDRVKNLTNGAQTPQTSVPEQRLIDPRIFMITSGIR